jgi:hypothetical protein
MIRRHSVVTTTDEGWTWLSPSRRGARLRQAFWSIVLSLLLIALAAAATLPPRPLAVLLVALVLGGGLWLTRTLWSRAHSAVAVSALGIAVRSGLDTAQIAWPALEAVLGVPHGKRLRIVVEARGARYRTGAAFTSDAALSWLATCADHARRRQLRPVPAGGSAGFRTTRTGMEVA